MSERERPPKGPNSRGRKGGGFSADDESNKERDEKPDLLSAAWLNAIVPQEDGSILLLPFEIRELIYRFALQFGTTSTLIIRPYILHGSIVPNYWDYNELLCTQGIEMYNTLILVSKLMYRDIVGGGILYSMARFTFNTPLLMFRYLKHIKLRNAMAITALEVRIKISKTQPLIPRSVLTTLSSLPALRYLTIHLDFAQNVCGYRVITQSEKEVYVYQPFRRHMEDIMNDEGWELVFENARRLTAKTITWVTSVDRNRHL